MVREGEKAEFVYGDSKRRDVCRDVLHGEETGSRCGGKNKSVLKVTACCVFVLNKVRS